MLGGYKHMSLVNAYLKRVLQSHQKGKADRLQDTFLVQCVLYLLQLHYLGGSRQEAYLGHRFIRHIRTIIQSKQFLIRFFHSCILILCVNSSNM